jgi:hypothetical protein
MYLDPTVSLAYGGEVQAKRTVRRRLIHKKSTRVAPFLPPKLGSNKTISDTQYLYRKRISRAFDQ